MDYSDIITNLGGNTVLDHTEKVSQNETKDKHFDPVSLGKEVRRLRKEKGWTLEKLSNLTAISQSNLSRLETGKIALSLERIHLVTNALGISFSLLLNESMKQPTPGVTRWRSVTHAGKGTIVEQDNIKFEYVCCDVQDQKLITGVATLKSKSLEEHGPMVQHPGEEFLHVLEGTVVFHAEHYHPITLEKGDSLKFDSMTPHAVYSGSDETTKVIYCITM